MNLATAGSPQSAQGKKKDPLRNFLAIDERERVVEWSQGMMGKLLIYVMAITAVATYFPWWESALVVSAAMAAAYRPTLRNPILFTATWTAAFLEIGFSENQVLMDIGVLLHREQVADISAMVLAFAFLLAVMVGAWVTLVFVRQNPKSFLARRPLITLLAVEALLCTLPALDVMQGLPRVLLWSMLIVLTPYVWFLPYAITDQRSRDPSDPLFQMAVLRPFWSPTYLPFGKGAAFLRKTLSKTPRDLAVTQLKAIKLLLWSYALLSMKRGLVWIFQDQIGVPGLGEAIDAFLLGQPFPIAVAWLSLILATAKYSLKIALWAGFFIGIARLAGYRLPRGSWRPLESRTLMEYFNRFHYYFKELLVDHFFVPTFFSVFRNRPGLRMFFATFMAAGVGNALWHFLYDIQVVTSMGLARALESFTSYAFYCLALATGIGLSQVRASRGIRPPSTLLGKLYSFLFVWSFVVCLHVFGDESRNHSLTERFLFFLNLFGVS